MCVLVLSNYFEAIDPLAASRVSTQIDELINRARVDQRAVAFLQCKEGRGFGGLGVRVGRYEPIFVLPERGAKLPSGLIEFIVRHAEASIEIAGVAAWRQFQRLQDTLQRSGYATMMARETTLIVSDAPRGNELEC
jgi:hypothetical protein